MCFMICFTLHDVLTLFSSLGILFSLLINDCNAVILLQTFRFFLTLYFWFLFLSSFTIHFQVTPPICLLFPNCGCTINSSFLLKYELFLCQVTTFDFAEANTPVTPEEPR